MPASIIASASSAKYAGPEPDTAVTASIELSFTRTTAPRCASASSASVTCASSACAPAQSPAIPSCTSDGVLGIARQTGTPDARCRSMVAVVIAAATESTVCSSEMTGPISPRSASMSCGLTASTTSAAPLAASSFESVVRMPKRSASSATRASRRADATMSSLPAPAGRKQARDEGLADLARSEDGDPPLGRRSCAESRGRAASLVADRYKAGSEG